MLLPPDLRSWVPENHIVHFLIEAVDGLPKRMFRYNHRGSGSAQYPPEMMLTLLIYSYVAGRFSSRLIEVSIRDAGHQPQQVLFDSGYYSGEKIEKAQANEDGPEVLVAVERVHHGRSVEELEQRDDPPEPDGEADVKERMKHRLRTKEGREIYRLRKQTVEPVFGIIKQAMGFRQMSMRGKEKAETEWKLLCLSYNLKRLFTLKDEVCPEKGVMA